MDNAAWGYRLGESGEIESRLFPEGRPADGGWQDTPAKCVPAAPPRPRGRRRKAADDQGS